MLQIMGGGKFSPYLSTETGVEAYDHHYVSEVVNDTHTVVSSRSAVDS